MCGLDRRRSPECCEGEETKLQLSRVSRRTVVAGFIATATSLALASTAFACTYNKGKSTISDSRDSNVTYATGNNTGMYWCNAGLVYGGTTYANGTPTSDSAGTIPVTASTAADASLSGTSLNALTWTQSPSTGTCASQVSDHTTYMITWVQGDPVTSGNHNCHNNKFNTTDWPFSSTVQGGVTNGTWGTWVGNLTVAGGNLTYNIPQTDITTAATPAGGGMTVGAISVCLQDSSNSKGSGNFDANLSRIQTVV